MKAAVVTGIERFEIRKVPRPVISHSQDVLIRVKQVGVCGSDIHYYKEGKIGEQRIEYPFVIGHECSGEVVAVGADVTTVAPGDEVVVDPLIPCFQCDQCNEGRFHTCRNQKFLGCPGQIDGALAEYIIMPQTACYKVNPPMNSDQAVLIEPLSVGLYAVQLAGSVSQKHIGILGVGPIGISVMLAAKLEVPNKIYVTDKLDYRLNIAKTKGAHWAANPDRTDIVQHLRSENPAGLDLVFECCGQQEALDQAIELLKPGGVLLIVGIPETESVSFDISQLRRKEITICNVRRQNNCIRPAMEAVKTGKIQPDFMLTHRFPLVQAEKAFQTVENYKDGVMKALIEID